MELIKLLIDFLLHIDKYLFAIVKEYDTWAYLILFIIVFCETGLVVTPFLPGDSLLFTAGAIAASGSLELQYLLIIFFSAAFIGDNVNYTIGKFIGMKVYEKNYKLVRRDYLIKTHSFYEKHGGKTLIIARFMPIIRTFAPFVAGAGTMKYSRFLTFCIVGNLLWVNLFCFAGFLFANNEFVKKNFTLVIFAIIIISIMPPIIAVIRQKFFKPAEINSK